MFAKTDAARIRARGGCCKSCCVFLKEEGMRLRTLSVLLCSLLFTWPAAAQEQRGTIEGVVKDTSGAVLPGVTVEARSAAGAVLTTVTDGTGTYRFPSVLPGTYEVSAT